MPLPSRITKNKFFYYLYEKPIKRGKGVVMMKAIIAKRYHADERRFLFF